MDASPGGVGNQQFLIDPNHNRVEEVNPAGSGLSYEYSGKGDLIGDGIFSYSWDVVGRLRGVLTLDASDTLVHYSYDARGFRIRSANSDYARQTILLRDSSGSVLSEYAHPSSTVLPEWRKDYIYAFGRHIAVIENVEPEIPTGITSSSSNGTVDLAWMAGTEDDLYGYDVYRWDGNGEPDYVLLTADAPDPSTSYHDSGPLISGTAYYYKILAVDEAGVESAAAGPRKIMVDDPAGPPIPTGFSASTTACDPVSVSWGAVLDQESDMAGYNLYRKLANDIDWPSIALNGSIPLPTISYMDNSGLSVGEIYDYRLEAVDAAGMSSGFTTAETVSIPDCNGGGGGGPGGGPPVRTIVSNWAQYRIFGSATEPSFRIRYYHTDHLGTPRIISDESGEGVAESNLFPYGDPVIGSTSGGNSHWLAGSERDYSVNQDYMIGRTYSLLSGRFTSVDRGRPNLGIPQSWNRYAYSFNNPIMYVDRSGREAYLVDLGGNATIGEGMLSVRNPATGGFEVFRFTGKDLSWWNLGGLRSVEGEISRQSQSEEEALETLDALEENGRTVYPFASTSDEDQDMIDDLNGYEGDFNSILNSSMNVLINTLANNVEGFNASGNPLSTFFGNHRGRAGSLAAAVIAVNSSRIEAVPVEIIVIENGEETSHTEIHLEVKKGFDIYVTSRIARSVASNIVQYLQDSGVRVYFNGGPIN